jgi:hypothetical protein
MELKTSGKMVSLLNQKNRKSKEQGGNNKHYEKMAMQEGHIINIALNGENTVHPSISNSTILLQEHPSGHVGLECSHHR